MSNCLEFGKPQRKFVDSKARLLELVKLYNHRADCYQTVYHYTKSETYGWRTAPVYETAILDKVFLDFDGLDTFKELKRCHKILLDKDLVHYVHFSGNGFHLYIALDMSYKVINKSAATKRFSLGISNEQDPKIPGDLARLCRILYTLHIKKNRYCIPLTGNDIENGIEGILEKSRTLNDLGWEMFGGEYLNLEDFDYPEEEKVVEDNFEVNVSAIPEDGLPACVHDALKSSNPNYWQRFIYFAYMQECGISMKSAISLVNGVWKKKKLKHCIYEERQPQTIYQGKLLVPSRRKVDEMGFCKKCGLCLGDRL